MATKATKRYLFPADYMADPSVHVFDGKIYIYPSHDWEASNVENDNGDQYIMKDYHVLSIDGDPMTGTVTDHGCVLRQEDIPRAVIEGLGERKSLASGGYVRLHHELRFPQALRSVLR